MNITTFGGPKDNGVRAKETGSITLQRLRITDLEEVYLAWFMPEFSEENRFSPIKVPSVERWLGGDGDSLKERIASANIALRDYLVEITSLDESGRILAGPVYARPIDRGPNTRFENPRIDGSRGLWKKLKVEHALRNPNSDEYRVNLVVRLVKKSDLEFLGPAEAEVQFSQNGGEKFSMPSWDEENGETAVAANP